MGAAYDRLLARPDDPGHPFDIVNGQAAIVVLGIDGLQVQLPRRLALEDFDQYFPVARFDNDSVAAPNIGLRRNDDRVSVTEYRNHAVA